MKKFFCLLMVLCVSIALAGCTQQPAASPTEAPAVTATPDAEEPTEAPVEEEPTDAPAEPTDAPVEEEPTDAPTAE